MKEKHWSLQPSRTCEDRTTTEATGGNSWKQTREYAELYLPLAW